MIAVRSSGGFGSSTRREQGRKKAELQKEDIEGKDLEEYFLFARQILSDANDDRGEWKALGDISVMPGNDVTAAIRTRQKEVEAASKKRLPKKSQIEIGYRLQHVCASGVQRMCILPLLIFFFKCQHLIGNGESAQLACPDSDCI